MEIKGYHYATDIGKVRTHNEDAVNIFKNENCILMVVADGMGGHAAGDVAARMTVDKISESFSDKLKFSSSEEARVWIKNILQVINQDILDHSKKYNATKGMGTTLVMALITNDFISFVNIGDSRAYILSYNYLRQITKDHTFVRRLVEEGQLSERAARLHPQKNVIVNSLGTSSSLEFDYLVLERFDIDAILLCTDGLTGLVEDLEILEIISTDEIIAKKIEKLISKANELGGNDNISVAMCEL